MNLKFAFFGTPDVASKTLEILKNAGYIPSLIVTAPDRPQGRKMFVTPPPVKVWAEENNVPYIQPEKITAATFRRGLPSDGEATSGIFKLQKFRTEEKFAFRDFDFFIVVAYGKILQEELINSPRLGSINIHYSLLPKYRGASPVEAAILAGDTETGVSIQQMEFKMDAGPILAEEKVAIGPDEKAEELRARLIEIGGNLLVKNLPDILEQKIQPLAQDESKATHCKKIKKEDGLVDPVNDDPQELYNKFRAYHKWPRIYYFSQDDKRVIITDAELKDGKFIIKKVIPQDKKEMTFEEFQKNF